MRKIGMVAMAAIGLGTAVLAHSGVKNPAVKARMDLMGEIKDATGVLGGMAKGEIAFDPARAAAAREALIEQAGRIPPAFEARETDPKSEARDEIWTDWDGFIARARAMEDAAAALNAGSLDGVRAGMGALGQSCGGCHKPYRIDK
ncbi:c-type cytochrome [Marimonas lutisalis]|uniref:c-type cytochrome n=1 Tax=Marimonas lutisalis TaxID=2545756 RepID=UPI001375CFD1|nr:cytochrome c [Marimonas lutisalis]